MKYIRHIESHNPNKALYRCDCGVEFITYTNNIKNSHTKSCGKKCKLKNYRSKSYKYKLWINIKTRCNNPNTPYYKHYGGRGIKIDETWLDFNQFSNDIGERPNNKYSLDRINNFGNYTKNNIRWVDQSTQMNNTRYNHVINWKDQTMNIEQWARYLGMKENTLVYRIKRGWSIDRAFTTPVKSKVK